MLAERVDLRRREKVKNRVIVVSLAVMLDTTSSVREEVETKRR